MQVFLSILLMALAATAPVVVYGTIMDRCSLAKEMYAMGVPKSDLPMWTCIAEHESHYNTDIVGPTNKDGTNDYGIFQINNRWWCKPSNGGKTANGCKINCNDLLGNLRNSINCALTVKKEQGWKAWATLKFCGGKLPSIDSCF